MKKYALILLASSCIATPVMAQDVAAKQSGFRVEALAGYDIVEVTVDEEVFGEEYSDDEGGIFYGAAIGYDFNIGFGTFGVEVELADAKTGVGETVVGDLYGYDVDGEWRLEAGRDLYIGARLAGPLSDRSLVYVKGGYTNARAELTAEGTVDGEFGRVSESATFDGFRVGVGAEHALSDSAYAKIEYRISSYGDGEAKFEGEAYDIGEIFDYGDLTRHQLVAGVGFRF